MGRFLIQSAFSEKIIERTSWAEHYHTIRSNYWHFLYIFTVFGTTQLNPKLGRTYFPKKDSRFAPKNIAHKNSPEKGIIRKIGETNLLVIFLFQSIKIILKQ